MNKLLTLSVAAYNVESMIRETLDSILECSLSEQIEVLVVNDGSTDSTLEYVTTYVRNYPGVIKLIDKANGGYGSTVNTAMATAEGRYFKLIDGDDWVDPEGLKELLRFLASHDVDMVVTKYVQVNPQTGKETVVEGNYPYTNKILPFDENSSYGVVPMHQLTFRTEVLRASGTKLMEGVPYTDAEFCIMPIPCVETIAYVDAIVYRYRLGYAEQSVSIASWQKNIDKGISVTFDMMDFYNYAVSMPRELSSSKKTYITRQIVCSLVNKYLLFLSFEPSKEIKKRLIAFDEAVRKYGGPWRDEASEVSIVVKMLLLTDFRLYTALSLAYRLKLKSSDRL